MIEDLKRILIEEAERRHLTACQLAEISGFGARTVQRALSTTSENAVVSIWVFEELYHALGIRLERKVRK